jgi:hypothetical protein
MTNERKDSMWLAFLIGFTIMLMFTLLAAYIDTAEARDPDGKYAQGNPRMHSWFESLLDKSGKKCCSDADGKPLDDDDWKKENGQYWVLVLHKWRLVPATAVLEQPNLFGRPVVWYTYSQGEPLIRCFIPGVMM